MQNNTVKELIQKLGEDYWFEIWTDNSEEPIVDGRDCYNAFDDYYDTEIKKVVIDHPNDEELQVIKLYIEQKVQPEPEIQAEPIKLKEGKNYETMPHLHRWKRYWILWTHKQTTNGRWTWKIQRSHLLW